MACHVIGLTFRLGGVWNFVESEYFLASLVMENGTVWSNSAHSLMRGSVDPSRKCASLTGVHL